MSTLAHLHTLEVGKLSLVQSILGHCRLQDTALCQPSLKSLCSVLPTLILPEKTYLCQVNCILVTSFWAVIGNRAMQTIMGGWGREWQTLYM